MAAIGKVPRKRRALCLSLDGEGRLLASFRGEQPGQRPIGRQNSIGGRR